MTVRVVVNGAYVARASSGSATSRAHAKVKKARCFDLEWDGPRMKPAPKRRSKKEKEEAKVVEKMEEMEQGQVESETEAEEEPPMATHDALRVLSNYNLHPWESLKLTSTSGSKVSTWYFVRNITSLPLTLPPLPFRFRSSFISSRSTTPRLPTESTRRQSHAWQPGSAPMQWTI